MKNQILKLLFKKDKAYLTNEKSLTLEMAGLPDIATVFVSTAYWTIRVINYIVAEKRIHCEVISYQVGETEFEENQKLLLKQLNSIEKITFRSIDTIPLIRTLKDVNHITFLPTKQEPFNRIQDYSVTEPLIRYPIRQFINETFFVPIKDIRFKYGGVAFDKKFKELNKTIELTIENYDIREEFDAIKNYFANVLNTKKIQVTVCIDIVDNEITSKQVKSPDIDKINKQIIDNVKFEFVNVIRKKIIVDIDKSVFTMDEYFDTFADKNFKSNTFYNDDKEFFSDLIAISNTKHYKQLRFLSSKHSHEIMKLRFVHKPFSFIFLINGDRNYHFIWETLDTAEATYIWHVSKDKKILVDKLKKIEDIINVIKVQGKTAYINSREDQYRRIYHDYSNLVDGFVKWKGELESILT